MEVQLSTCICAMQQHICEATEPVSVRTEKHNTLKHRLPYLREGLVKYLFFYSESACVVVRM